MCVPACVCVCAAAALTACPCHAPQPCLIPAELLTQARRKRHSLGRSLARALHPARSAVTPPCCVTRHTLLAASCLSSPLPCTSDHLLAPPVLAHALHFSWTSWQHLLLLQHLEQYLCLGTGAAAAACSLKQEQDMSSVFLHTHRMNPRQIDHLATTSSSACQTSLMIC